MGQLEVCDALKDDEWITSKEISKTIGYLSHSSITESLRRLYKKNIIETKRNPDCSHGLLYKLK